jgi:hypothetical protein
MRRVRFRSAVAALLALCGAASVAAEEPDYYLGFVQLLAQHGWRGDTSVSAALAPKVSHRATALGFEFPEGDGYYPRIDLTELTFASADKVPLQDGRIDQLYLDGPAYGRTRAFPIQDFRPFFSVDSWEHFEYIAWSSYRRGRRVYIVHTMPVRQRIDELFGWLVAYVRARAGGDAAALQSLEQKMAAVYAEQKDRHEGVEALQAILKARGAYRGTVDGMFGLGTRRALQIYLKQEGHYRGPTDGWWQATSRRALRSLQKALGVKVTGSVTLETARAIEQRSAQ